MMEADSTTYDNNQKLSSLEPSFPFYVHPENLQIYKELTEKKGDGVYEHELVKRLQDLNLLPRKVQCSKKNPDCGMKCVSARVVDRLQWLCKSCETRLPVRGNSFFKRLHCSLLQNLQMILAWCEDADWEVASKYFGVKPKLAYSIFDKMDQLVIEDHSRQRLGGEGSVVLAEMYPDCLNRLSPDTTGQPHVHRVLMLADTNYIPTRYWLHVVKDTSSPHEVSLVINKAVHPESTLVIGNYVPMIEGAVSLQTLTQHCDAEMQHFLCERIWRQALSVCAASRDLCAERCVSAAGVQRYLSSALQRLRHNHRLFTHVLGLLAQKNTPNDELNSETVL